MAEAHALGLRTTTHIGWRRRRRRTIIELGVSSIEHFYGMPTRRLYGVQRFPPDMNYSNEVQRFARAGAVDAGGSWQAQSDRRHDGRDHVGWSPTLSIYEASRDVTGAISALVQGIPAPRAPGFLRPSLATTGRISRVDEPQEAAEATIPRLDGRPARVRQQGRPRDDGDDAGYIYSNIRLRDFARAGAPRGAGSSRSK